MKKTSTSLFLIIIVFLMSSSLFAKEEWKLVSDKDGIKISSREVKDSKYKEYKAEIVTNNPFEVGIELTKDYKNYHAWYGMCKELKLVSKKNENDYDMYFVLDMPVVSDRDVVVNIKTKWDFATGKGRVDMKDIATSKHKQDSGLVRMPELYASFTITRIDANKTKTVYQFFADTGGSVPAWVVNMSAKKHPKETMEGIMKQLSGKKYYEKANKAHNKTFKMSK
ncbi:MAG: hypothetical protein GY845_38400 [Planctomycetes bacterium]|nr:hypothetical protein [Planctomycetota bacterium]